VKISKRSAEAGIEPTVGSIGDSYDCGIVGVNAVAEGS
jgi:hypothetical protein